jgi:hypothetical protein
VPAIGRHRDPAPVGRDRDAFGRGRDGDLLHRAERALVHVDEGDGVRIVDGARDAGVADHGPAAVARHGPRYAPCLTGGRTADTKEKS